MKPAASYSWKEDCRKIYYAKRYPIEWQGADLKTYERWCILSFNLRRET